MQHRNNSSNAWLVTHINSLLDVNKEGGALWEPQCRGKGTTAALYSTPINSKQDAETYQQYLSKKGINSTILSTDSAETSVRIIIPVADQHMKKTRFNTTHTDVANNQSLQKILKMLNDATSAEFGKWEVSADHSGRRLISCVAHRKLESNDSAIVKQSLEEDGVHLTKMINKMLAQGAFSEESRRSIRHYFLDNLYVETHEKYNMYSIIDLAFMEQIEIIESMSSG